MILPVWQIRKGQVCVKGSVISSETQNSTVESDTSLIDQNKVNGSTVTPYRKILFYSHRPTLVQVPVQTYNTLRILKASKHPKPI